MRSRLACIVPTDSVSGPLISTGALIALRRRSATNFVKPGSSVGIFCASARSKPMKCIAARTNAYKEWRTGNPPPHFPIGMIGTPYVRQHYILWPSRPRLPATSLAPHRVLCFLKNRGREGGELLEQRHHLVRRHRVDIEAGLGRFRHELPILHGFEQR